MASIASNDVRWYGKEIYMIIQLLFLLHLTECTASVAYDSVCPYNKSMLFSFTFVIICNGF